MAKIISKKIKKYKGIDIWYWTRTPSSVSPYYVYYVYSDGTVNAWNSAYRGDYGVVPAFYLKS